MKNILALLADFANGIFAVLLVSFIFEVEPVWWYYAVGIIFSMSPDIDALPELLQRGKVSASADHLRDHRTFIHYPLVTLLLGIFASLFFGYWGTLWLVAVVLHLLNDLYGTGWGLPVFWPVSSAHYKCGSRRANQLKSILIAKGLWDELSAPEQKLHVVTHWDKSELPDYIKRFGMDDWIEHYYLKINYVSIIEYSLFGFAVVLLGFDLL